MGHTYFLLLATENNLPPLSYPWWVTNALVPAAISVLGSLLTLLIGITVASRTEWYHRLSRWESYGKDLWLIQVKLYIEIFEAAHRVMPAACNRAFNWHDATQEKKQEFDNIYCSAKAKMDELRDRATILLNSSCFEIYQKLVHRIYMVATSSGSNSYAMTYSDEMYDLYSQLLDSARMSIGTDILGKMLKEEILKEIKPKTLTN